MRNILEMENISISFGGVEVLHDVSFNVRRGEIHSLIGENGAGKSTLMKIISGVYIPDRGTIRKDIRTALKSGFTVLWMRLPTKLASFIRN